MGLILQFETATTSCSVALARDGNVIAFREINERNIHAEVITVFIDDIINAARITYDDLDAVAVSCGPGSYTGLRIGVSAAKGICFALDKPLIAVETLEAMTYGVLNGPDFEAASNLLLCPMIDARRMEVFTAVFTTAGEKIAPTSAVIIDENSFAELLKNNRMLFFGDGAEKCKATLGSNPNAAFLTAFINSAVHLTQKANDKFQKQEFVDVARFEPYYLKDFIAGIKKNI